MLLRFPRNSIPMTTPAATDTATIGTEIDAANSPFERPPFSLDDAAAPPPWFCPAAPLSPSLSLEDVVAEVVGVGVAVVGATVVVVGAGVSGVLENEDGPVVLAGAVVGVPVAVLVVVVGDVSGVLEKEEDAVVLLGAVVRWSVAVCDSVVSEVVVPVSAVEVKLPDEAPVLDSLLVVSLVDV